MRVAELMEKLKDANPDSRVFCEFEGIEVKVKWTEENLLLDKFCLVV